MNQRFSSRINAISANYLTSTVVSAVAFTPDFSATQVSMKIAAYRFIFVDNLVNRLMTETNRSKAFEPEEDFFRSQVYVDHLLEDLPCIRMNSLAGFGLVTFFCYPLVLLRTIASKTGISKNFSTNCGFVPVQFQCNFALVKAYFQEGVFFLGELLVSPCAFLSWRLEDALNYSAACPLTNSYRVALKN